MKPLRERALEVEVEVVTRVVFLVAFWLRHKKSRFWIKFDVYAFHVFFVQHSTSPYKLVVLAQMTLSCQCSNINLESFICRKAFGLKNIATRTQLAVSTMPHGNSGLIRLPRPVDECLNAASKSNKENPCVTCQSGSSRADPERPESFYLTQITQVEIITLEVLPTPFRIAVMLHIWSTST